MRKRWVGLVVAATAAAMPAAAAAADLRVGSQADAAGDATFALGESGPPSALQLVDLAALRVEFDADSGSLRLDFDGDLNGVGRSGLTLRAGLAAPGTGGTCTTTNTGDYVVTGFESGRGRSGAPPTATLSTSAGTVLATGTYEDEDQTGTGPRLTFAVPALAGQDLRCVTGVSAVKASAGFLTPSSDDLDPFCLGTCPAVRAPLLSAAGGTLTWDKVAYFGSYVVESSTAPEGSPGRQTTTQTVTGTSFTPSVAVGETRYFRVRVDADGARWSGPEVAISVPAPPVAPVVLPPAVAPRPVTATEDLRDPPALTAAAARSAARRALGASFRVSFPGRSAAGYRLTCTVKGTRASCAARWRYHRLRFQATASLSAQTVGARTAVSVTRLVVIRT